MTYIIYSARARVVVATQTQHIRRKKNINLTFNTNNTHIRYCYSKNVYLLQLLLGSKLIGTSAFLLSAVGRARRKTSVALTADHLVAVEFTSKSSEGRIDGTSTKTKDKMKCGLLGDVVVAEVLPS